MSDRALRVLYVLPQLPYPPDRGGKIVQYYLIRHILERHSVRVAALVHHESDEEHAESFRKICPHLYTFPAAGRWSVPRLAKAVFSSKPYKAHRFYSPEMAAFVQDCVRDGSVDVIHCQNFYTAQYVTGQEPCGRVLYKENFESLLLKRFVEESGHPALLRLAARSQVSRTQRYEVEVCSRFDRVLMISDADRERFAQYSPPAPLDVLPPGVDLEHLTPSTEPPIAGRVVFTGSMDYFPNVDAVRFFCEEVWPGVRREVPGAEFYIVGQRPEEAVQQWQGKDGITVTGRVEDVRPYLAEASVYVVPLRAGGGVRLKILEAMAMGKATVSTSVGAEGLGVRAGENIVLADNAEAMTREVVALLKSSEKRQALEWQARRFAEKHGGWDRVGSRLEEIYREVSRRYLK